MKEWGNNNLLRESEEYQDNYDIFRVQVQNIIKGLSSLIKKDYVKEEDKAKFSKMITDLEASRDGAIEDPEKFAKRQAVRGGSRGRGLVPDEYRPIIITKTSLSKDEKFMIMRVYNRIRREAKGEVYIYREMCAFYMGDKYYTIIPEEFVDGKENIVAVREYMDGEVLDWRYATTSNEFRISDHPEIKAFIGEVKNNPSILDKYIKVWEDAYTYVNG